MNEITLYVFNSVWRHQPAAFVESHHADSGSGATDQAHRGHFVSSLLQHLPIYVHWEYLRIRAHTHHMQAHRGMGTHIDVWKEKPKNVGSWCLSSSHTGYIWVTMSDMDCMTAP